MAKVIVLNFEGALQSWAGFSVVKTRVDTQREPGVRAVRGLLGAALGQKRWSDEPELLKSVKISILKTVKSGKVVRDFHTTSLQDKAKREGANPHDSEFYEKLALVYAQGKTSKIGGLTLLQSEIIERTYLADAQFLVQVQCGTDEQTEELYECLQSPVWSPYLGRKAFPANFNFLLGTFDKETAEEEAMKIITYINEELKSYV